MDSDAAQLEVILAAVAAGSLAPAEAATQLKRPAQVDLGFARFDLDRQRRTGVPEVIFAAGKTPEQLLALVEVSLDHHQQVLATRTSVAQAALVTEHFGELHYDPTSRLLLSEPKRDPACAPVAVVSAGTSDGGVAEEAAGVLAYLGHPVDRLFDVGVAGLHRLLRVHDRLQAARALVVVAGMEGALPSVVAGLVATPVIAVPTSVGYGVSFGGVAALLAMLNSCAAGVAVVNIDNGFGAAMLAHRIAHAPEEQR